MSENATDTETPRGNESVTPDQVRSRVKRLFHRVNVSLIEWDDIANDLLGAATRISDLERQLAEARMAFAIVTDKLVVEQSAHRRTRERIDRIADALRGIRKHWTWVVDPECDCEDCEFSRPIDEALATLERKEEG